jgi:hypothetical protein
LNRARTNGLDTEDGAEVQAFRKLGELILGSACPWVSRELAANMLIPPMKNSTGNDTRPASAKLRLCGLDEIDTLDRCRLYP